MNKSLKEMVGFGGDLSSILAVAVPAIVLLIGGSGLAAGTWFPWHWMVVVGILSAAFFLLGASLLAAFLVGRHRMLGRDINADWVIVSDRRIAHVYSRTRIDYRYHVVARARKASDTLRMRADWSGAGRLDVVSLRQDCVPVLEAGSGNEDYFRIIAPFPVAKGQEFTFEFKIETDAVQYEAKPVFGIRVTNGRRKAGQNELSVVFDANVDVVEDRIVGHHFRRDASFPEIVALPLDGASRSVKLPFTIEAGSKHVIFWEYR